jgi:hypothetical protein
MRKVAVLDRQAGGFRITRVVGHVALSVHCGSGVWALEAEIC